MLGQHRDRTAELTYNSDSSEDSNHPSSEASHHDNDRFRSIPNVHSISPQDLLPEHLLINSTVDYETPESSLFLTPPTTASQEREYAEREDAEREGGFTGYRDTPVELTFESDSTSEEAEPGSPLSPDTPELSQLVLTPPRAAPDIESEHDNIRFMRYDISFVSDPIGSEVTQDNSSATKQGQFEQSPAATGTVLGKVKSILATTSTKVSQPENSKDICPFCRITFTPAQDGPCRTYHANMCLERLGIGQGPTLAPYTGRRQ